MRFGFALVGVTAFGFLAGRAGIANAVEPSGTNPQTPKTDLRAELSCGATDPRLQPVAERIVERKKNGQPVPDSIELQEWLRAADDPDVWPRAWVVSGRTIQPVDTGHKFRGWLHSLRVQGERRCAVAVGRSREGLEVAAAVVVDGLADLKPIPLRAHAGQWLDVDATFRVPIQAGKVVVAGPSGPPRTILSHSDGSHIRAKFAPDRTGVFTIQVLADLGRGPRPVLETNVFVDVDSLGDATDAVAPGERPAAPPTSDAIFAMLNGARTVNGVAPLNRDPALDQLAVTHAAAMRRSKALGHDIGDGDPGERANQAGLVVREIGENVAHAANAAVAHRSLYASPSHRANLLRSDFTHVGIGLAKDADGSLWLAEIFAR